MELSEALRTIDATAGFLIRINGLMNSDVVELGDDKENWELLEVQIYSTVRLNSGPEFKFNLKYRNGQEEEFVVPNIIPVCHYLIDTWPLPQAKQIRSHLVESNVLNLADDILGFDDPMMYETSFEAQEYSRLTTAPSRLFDVIYDINYHLAYALRMIEAWEEEERPSFLVNVDKSEEEARSIDKELRNLARFPSIPAICLRLADMARERKILLPDAENAYEELVRLGMQTGRGFTLKTFKNNYQKPKV
ncbi:hypothetical protein SAMN04487901_11185 [Prevotella communis]|uniref:Uncharacterized protein n=1 Tax=Prevotella communis TaxID=2913614 RepID=A0A1G7XTY0_9BACT|nr:hypothetical protein [Prevotella communis]SDG87627.1 hypothetical protein SAMN04487901_11185 [Prevotella communis]